MTLTEAERLIARILESIPDDELPEFSRVTYGTDGMPIVWHGGTGQYLGSARRGRDERDPSPYRSGAIRDAIFGEMCYRADRFLLDRGDDPTGIDFTARPIRVAS